MYSNDKGFICAVYIRSDNKYYSYSRKVMDILTALGQIGGLYSALIGAGIVISSFIVDKLYMSDIVKRVYHVRKYESIIN